MRMIAVVLSLFTTAALHAESPVFPQLQSYIAQRTEEFSKIPAERKARLEQLADFITKRRAAGMPASLTFICTHNSRRSHMSQIWAATAARHYGIDDVRTYSGGTESTAFNPRAVKALGTVGFRLVRTTDDDNPVYHVRYADQAEPLTAFSKVYNQAPNPAEDFCAIMTCTSADEACPNVAGAVARIAIPYEDPKAFDGTKDEARMYAERCAQISRELLYVFSRVKK